MARRGVKVGQVFVWQDERGAVRILRVDNVAAGQATAIVEKWRGRPEMVGMRVMLPDDWRYRLREKTSKEA